MGKFVEVHRVNTLGSVATKINVDAIVAYYQIDGRKTWITLTAGPAMTIEESVEDLDRMLARWDYSEREAA